MTYTGAINIQGVFYGNATGIPTYVVPTGYILSANGNNTASWIVNTASSNGGSTFSGVMSGIASGLQFYGENTAIINQTVGSAVGSLQLQVAGNTAITLAGAGIKSANLGITGPYSTSAYINTPATGTILAARNAANSNDIVIALIDGSNNVHFGDLANASNVALYGNTSASIQNNSGAFVNASGNNVIIEAVSGANINLEVGNGTIILQVQPTGISITGQSTFNPPNVGQLTSAVIDTQIFTAHLTSGTYTGIIATIPLYGASGTTPVGTGITEIDTQTSMVSLTSNDGGRFKQSLQWIGVGTALAAAMGPLMTSLAVGTNGGAVPTAWNAAIQLDPNKNNAQIVASISTGTVNVRTVAQYGYAK